MPWFAWVVVVYLIVNTGVILGQIGQRRNPLTGGDAILAIIAHGVIILIIANGYGS